MNYYWDKIEKKVYTRDMVIEKGEDKFAFLKKIGVLQLILEDRSCRINNFCILVRRGKYKILTKRSQPTHKKLKKYLNNLQFRGWVIVKAFDEDELRDV